MEISQSLQGLIRSPYTTLSDGMNLVPETTPSPPFNGQGDMAVTLSETGLRQSALALSADELSKFETFDVLSDGSGALQNFTNQLNQLASQEAFPSGSPNDNWMPDESWQGLNDIGIDIQSTGQFTLNPDMAERAINTDPNTVNAIVQSTAGSGVNAIRSTLGENRATSVSSPADMPHTTIGSPNPFSITSSNPSTTTIQDQINDALAEKNLDATTTDEIQNMLDKLGLSGTQNDNPATASSSPSTPINTSPIAENNTDAVTTSAPDGTNLENGQIDPNIQSSSNNTNTTPGVQSNLPNGNLQSIVDGALAEKNVNTETAGQIQDILDKFGMGGTQTGNSPFDAITAGENGSPISNQSTANSANALANESAKENANQTNNGYTPNNTQGSASSSAVPALQTQDYLLTRQTGFVTTQDAIEHTLEPHNLQSTDFMEQQIARQNRLNGVQLLAAQEYEQLNQLFDNMARFTDQLHAITDEQSNKNEITSSSNSDVGLNDTQEQRAIADTTFSSLLDESTVPTPNIDANRHHRRDSVSVSA